MKTIVAAGVVVISALTLLGCGGSTETTTITVVETETVTETVESAPEQEPSTTEDTGSQSSSAGRTERTFKQTGIDDGVSFSVTGWQEAQQIPQGEFTPPASAGAGAKFVLVDVAVTNRGKQSITPFCGGGGAILIDKEDRNFEPDSSLAVSIPENPTCDDLQPGFREEVTLVFKLPKSAKQDSVAVWSSDAPDDYGGESSYVIFAPK